MSANTDIIATTPAKPVVGRCSQCRVNVSVAPPDIPTATCATCGLELHFQAACIHCGHSFFILANAIDTQAPCPHCGKELLLAALCCADGTMNVVSTTGRFETRHLKLGLALTQDTGGTLNPQSDMACAASHEGTAQQAEAQKGFSVWFCIGTIQRVLSIIYLIGEVSRQYISVNGQTPERQPCIAAFAVGLVATWVAYCITNPYHARLTFYRYLLWMIVSGIPLRLVSNFIICGITNNTDAFWTHTAVHALFYGVLIAVAYAIRPKGK
jgi:hypothetical protein